MDVDKKKRILVVDDEVEICRLLQDVLEKAGYDVVVAHRGDAAIALAQSRHPQLILMDVLMPGGLDGVQTYHRLKGRSSTREIPVIFVTAVEAGGTISEQKLPLGERCTVIGKPFRFEQLLQAITRLLQPPPNPPQTAVGAP